MKLAKRRSLSKALEALVGSEFLLVDRAPMQSNMAVNSQHSFSPGRSALNGRQYVLVSLDATVLLPCLVSASLKNTGPALKGALLPSA